MSQLFERVLYRLPVAAAFLLIAITLSYGYAKHGTVASAWRQLNVAVEIGGPFEDLQTITYSVDCMRAGQDPYRTNCDPARRPLNYPPVWLLLRYLGVNGRNSNALGWLFVSTVALAYLISLSARTLFSGIAAFAAVFLSRPLALAMERGNTDEVIFLLLVLSCLLASKFPSRAQGWFIAGAAVLLACLKVYPAVTAVAALKSRWGRWLVPTAAVASAGALVITAGSRLKNVLEGTPAMVVGSFGVIPLVNAVGRATHWNAAGWIQGHRVANSVLAVVLFLFFAGIGLRFRRHLEGRLPALGAPTFRGTLAASCAAIYCFAFIGGASFNYRLIFLTGVLALLLRANDDGLYSVRPYAVTIVLYLAIPGRFIVLHEACDAAVFGFLSAWLAVMCQQAIGSKSAMEEQGLHPNFAALVEAPQR